MNSSTSDSPQVYKKKSKFLPVSSGQGRQYPKAIAANIQGVASTTVPQCTKDSHTKTNVKLKPLDPSMENKVLKNLTDFQKDPHQFDWEEKRKNQKQQLPPLTRSESPELIPCSMSGNTGSFPNPNRKSHRRKNTNKLEYDLSLDLSKTITSSEQMTMMLRNAMKGQ